MKTIKVLHPTWFWLIFLAFIFFTGCTPTAKSTVPGTLTPPSTPTGVASSSPTVTIPTRTLHTPTPSVTPTPTTPTEPDGCNPPKEDYEIISINGNLLNRRTLSMLEYAQELYGGEIDLTGYAITQGSFHDNGAASFGTHLGGGAVDLSVMRSYTYTVLYDDIPPLLEALRIAGFAAWLREPDEVYQGSAIHIHAIAIGDRDLSPAALAQLTGEAGYFYGFSGLPPKNGIATLDRFGGPVLCQWMKDLGYEDLHSKQPAEN